MGARSGSFRKAKWWEQSGCAPGAHGVRVVHTARDVVHAAWAPVKHPELLLMSSLKTCWVNQVPEVLFAGTGVLQAAF